MTNEEIKKMWEAYQSVVSEGKVDPKLVKQAIGIASDKRYAGGNMTGAATAIEKLQKGLSNHPQVAAVLRRQNEMKEEKEECPKCKGDGCDHCDGKGYHEMDEAKKLDPVDDAENDKPFAKRKDKDINNDGKVDGSDEFLHKKRAATDDAIDGGKKPADNAKEDPKKKKGGNPRTSDKTAEISKIESVTTKESFEALWSAIEEAVNQKKGATPPEGMDDKESKSGKDFKAMHKVDVKTHDELEKIEEPKERKVKKEMTEFEVIRALLSGKPTGE